MNLKLFNSTVIVLVFLISQIALAGQQAGQRPAAYLELGAGGVQNSMGGAAIADRSDVACGFWNPAGLSGLRGWQVQDQYSLLSLGQELNYFAVANGYQGHIFYGINFVYYSAGGDIEARNGPTLAPDSVFRDNEMTFMPSLAFRLNPRWSIGVNFKIMTQTFDSYSGLGFGEDLGTQFRLTKFTTFGLVVQDPFTFFNYDNSTGTIVPLTVKAGVCHEDEKLSGKLNFDLEWSADLGLRPRLGLEWRPADVLALRVGCWAGNLTGGVSGDGLSLNPTCGFGLVAPLGGNPGESSLELDYTLIPDPIISGRFIHQLAITGKFL